MAWPSGASSPTSSRKTVPSSAAAGIPVGVLNLQGQVFMVNTDSPFRIGDACLEEMRGKHPGLKVVLVDIHAEASSEKQAVGWWFDGRVSAVIGSHTHVPTADARILPRGTAYQGDAGMTGAYEGIIGFDPKNILERLLPVYVETEVYRALLESAASEQGARMTAMRNASKSAGELIDNLTLAMNRARQAEITQEILEVVAGAEALR